MKSSSLIVLCISASFGAAVVAGCGGDSSDEAKPLPAGVVARVGDKTITRAAIDRQLTAKLNLEAEGETLGSWGPPGYAGCIESQHQRRTSGTEADLKRQCVIEFRYQRAQVIEALLDELWVTAEAKRRGIDVSGEVKKSTEAQRKHMSAKALRRIQQAEGEAALQLRNTLEYAKLRAAMPVSEREITAYGGANADVFLDSEQRHVHVIQSLTKRESQRARTELEGGASWAEVSDRYGLKPFNLHWTGTHWARESNATHDAFGRSLFSQKIGKLTGPINTLNGWFLFEVIAIRQPKSRDLSPEAHATVALTIRSHKLQRVLHDRYDSKTDCQKEYEIPEIPQCMDAGSAAS